MTWGLVATAAVTVVGGVVNAKKSKKAAKAQDAINEQNEELSWQQNLSDNKAIAEANLQNQIRTGFKVGLLNVQRAQAKKQLAADGYSLSKTAAQLTGAATANAAANGTIGSSVDAVQSDIQMRIGEAQIDAESNYYQQEANFDTQMYDILMAGQDVQRAPAAINVQDAPPTPYTSVGESLVGSALQIGGSYLSSTMSLGLGSKKAPTVGTPGQLSLSSDNLASGSSMVNGLNLNALNFK